MAPAGASLTTKVRMPGQGDTVPYIICVKKAEDGSIEATKGLAERAHHPEEITDNPQLTVDNEYYLGQQVSIGWSNASGQEGQVWHSVSRLSPSLEAQASLFDSSSSSSLACIILVSHSEMHHSAQHGCCTESPSPACVGPLQRLPTPST